MKKIKVKNYTMDVPPELRRMALDIACMSGPIPRPVNEVLMRALRSGLAHLLVLTEEDVKYRLKQ